MLTIRVLSIRPLDFLHHKIFLIFQTAKNQSKKTEKLRQLKYVDVWRELLVKNFVLKTVCVIWLEDINNFKHENSTCFSIDPLTFNLVPGVIVEELLLTLELGPDLV